jgi:N,N'-diacetyllegionaminate synthase
MILVAEIGLNHDGNFDLIYEMIRQAKNSGANIAKFQVGWRDKPGEINNLDQEKLFKIKEMCEYLDIEMMASIINEQAFDLVSELKLKRLKIASRTVKEKPDLCKKIINTNKEVFCSLGFVDNNLNFFEKNYENVRFIYCISKYPTYVSDIKNFPKQFSKDKYFGYSDHMHGIGGCLLALSRGAEFIEKHFTLNKTSQVIRDHTLSATPDEFKIISTIGRELQKLSDK